MIQKLANTQPPSPAEADDLLYASLASCARLAELAGALGSNERAVRAFTFDRARAIAVGDGAREPEAVAIAEQLCKSGRAAASAHGWFAAAIGVPGAGTMLVKAALVARTGTRAAPGWQATIEACAAALSRELEARLELRQARAAALADRRYLQRAFASGLQEVKRVADEVRSHCMNLPVVKQPQGPTAEERAIRATVLLADRLRGLETWLRLAEPGDGKAADSRRALKLALTRLHSAFALGENQLRVSEPLPAVDCDEARFTTLIEETVKVLLRRELPIRIEAVASGRLVHIDLACQEILPTEPPDPLETLPFGHASAIKSGDLSLALVEQIARAAGGALTLGPGFRIRVTLPALEPAADATTTPPSRTGGVKVE
ncbi:MAG: hypothetical protein U1E76_05140 [Planctomycetota bacterium]